MSLGLLFKAKPATDAALGGAVVGNISAQKTIVAETNILMDSKIKLKAKASLHILIQLKAMLEAGVPLLAAMRTLIVHAETPASGKALRKITQIVENGHDLSFAMQCLPRCFEPFVVHLLAAGEQSGAMDQSLGRSIDLLRKQIELGGKIRGALAYPGFLLFMTMAMTTGILVLLVPKFESMLMSKPDQLPGTTKIVLAASAFLRDSPMAALIAASFLLGGSYALMKSKKAQGAAFELAGHIPVLGTFIRKAYLARSVSTLALTLECGVPILAGIEHAREVARLPRLQSLWESAGVVVRDGHPMYTAFEDANLPPALIQMMIAGESSGCLDESLSTAADFLDRETQTALNTFTTLLGPATVMLAGAVVGFIVIALMTPILQMAKFVG